MQLKSIEKKITEVVSDALVVGVFEESDDLPAMTAEVDAATDGAIASHIKKEKFEGKAVQITDLTPAGGVKASRVIIVGLGKRDKVDANAVRKAAGAAAKRARDLQVKTLAIAHIGSEAGLPAEQIGRAIAEGAVLSVYRYTQLKTEDPKPNPTKDVFVVASDAENAKKLADGLRNGEVIAESVRLARDLINGPANIVTPTYLAEQAKAVCAESGLSCQVIEPAEMSKMGMNLLLAVAKGSSEEPRFVVMRYKNSSAKKSVALVGKGITYDAGGLCLKGSGGLENSRVDMSGAAAVIGAMKAVAALKPNVNVLGIVPTTENMPDGSSTKPGDVFTGLSGKSVEINNTDAEGRLIVAEGVAFAEKEGVDEIIDIATLTGACVAALGGDMAGIMGTDQQMIDQLIAAGAKSGEIYWQFPLHTEYEETLKSDLADMKNCTNTAGTITGGLFIKMHVKSTAWVHLDIAGTCVSDKDTPTCPKGAAGFGVATLVNYLMAKI